MKDTKALLQQLTDLNGIAGHEYNIKGDERPFRTK